MFQTIARISILVYNLGSLKWAFSIFKNGYAKNYY